MIWNKLNSTEIKTLRLTCGLIKSDIENISGVSAVLEDPRTTVECLAHYSRGESLGYWTGGGII